MVRSVGPVQEIVSSAETMHRAWTQHIAEHESVLEQVGDTTRPTRPPTCCSRRSSRLPSPLPSDRSFRLVGGLAAVARGVAGRDPPKCRTRGGDSCDASDDTRAAPRLRVHTRHRPSLDCPRGSTCDWLEPSPSHLSTARIGAHTAPGSARAKSGNWLLRRWLRRH